MSEAENKSPDQAQDKVQTCPHCVRRWDLGFFVRKVVKRRKVRGKRAPVRTEDNSEARSSKTGKSGEDQVSKAALPVVKAAEAPEPGVAALAESSTADDDESNTEETSFEAGIFFKQESSSPPEYPSEPIG